LPDPYVASDERDYICSQAEHDGMTKCADIQNYMLSGGVICNSSAVPFGNNTPSGGFNGGSVESCVNWNQYYGQCKTGLSNPYKGAISFDNIGLAWVAIFQVRKFDVVC